MQRLKSLYMNTLHRTQNFRSNFGYATEWECIVENIVASAALYYITLHSTITGWFRLTQPRGSGLEFRIDANSLKIHTRSQNWVNKVPEYKNVLSKICNVEIGSIRCKGDLFWADAWTVLCICKKKKHPHHHHHRLNYTEILHVIQKTIMAMLPLVYLQRWYFSLIIGDLTDVKAWLLNWTLKFPIFQRF